MQGYEEFAIWPKLERLLDYCNDQKEAVKRGLVEELLAIQAKKLEIIKHIEIGENLPIETQKKIKQTLLQVAKCEKELEEMVRAKMDFLVKQIKGLGEGVHALRYYQLKNPKPPKFLSVKG